MGGSFKATKNLKKVMKLTCNWIWNSRRWWGVKDIFWNYTELQKLTPEKMNFGLSEELHGSRAEVIPCKL